VEELAVNACMEVDISLLYIYRLKHPTTLHTGYTTNSCEHNKNEMIYSSFCWKLGFLTFLVQTLWPENNKLID